jgi:hypothetical protein
MRSKDFLVQRAVGKSAWSREMSCTGKPLQGMEDICSAEIFWVGCPRDCHHSRLDQAVNIDLRRGQHLRSWKIENHSNLTYSPAFGETQLEMVDCMRHRILINALKHVSPSRRHDLAVCSEIVVEWSGKMKTGAAASLASVPIRVSAGNCSSRVKMAASLRLGQGS